MFRFFRTAFAAVVLLSIAPMMNAQTNPDGHELVALWKQYDEAHKADRPQKEADILSKIKVEAQKRHLAVDFYDAATKYVETVQRRDWKKRDELRKNLAQEVKDFDEPLVTFLWMGDVASSDERWAYVKPRSDAFRAGKHSALWRGIDGLMGGALKYAVDKTKAQVADNIRARAMRPLEGAVNGAAAAVTVKSDVRKLTKADREEIARQVMKGKTITFS